ncbi:MAG: phospholipid carrier-dependent glycosyltransferase [Prolixibacteraceae bacterium]|nr:phospholipid carrier-dependent glycosyltransferase [Prolixibacteraceae bacterium]
MVLTAAILVGLAPKAAVNVDEQLHYPYAKKVVNWYFTRGKDKSCLETPVTNLKYYGQSVDNFTALVNRVFSIKNEFLTRHLTGAFFFWILLLFTGLIAYRLSSSYWASVIAVLSVIFMPRVFGQAFGNLKDIPFAAGYAAGIYFILQFLAEMPRPKWKTAIYLGLAIAFTSSVRIGGLILLAYLVLFSTLFFTLKPFGLKQNVSTKPCLVRLMGLLTVITIIGYFAGFLFWPFALQDVFSNPFVSLQVMEHYKVSIRQIFNGNLFWSTQLPWYYFPKWMLISTPEFVILGFLVYSFVFSDDLIRSKKKIQKYLFDGLVIFSFFFPIFYVIIIHSNLYSGIRQMLFVFPMLSVMVASGVFRWLKSDVNKKLKFSVAFLFFALMILPLKHQASTFPVDYVYFNSISGGNKKAWGNYEYDYYFHAIKRPADYLLKKLKNKNDVIVASNCNLSNYFNNAKNVSWQYTRFLERSSVNWDYGLFGVNYIHPFQLKNNTWQPAQIIKIFYQEGNPVAVLVKRPDKSDFMGLQKIEQGNIEEGMHLLEQVIQKDSNNVWLFVNLAKSCLARNDTIGFEEYLKRGQKIHPFYEPLFLLKAQRLFDEKRYKESFEVLQSLIAVNNRYRPAAPLLRDVKEKLEKK